MSAVSGSWITGHERRRDETSHELSSFDVLGGLPSFPTTTTHDGDDDNDNGHDSLLYPARSSQPQPACLSGAAEGIAHDTGRSTGSGLELQQALERTNCDSDQELEAIRGSVRSLRAQRAAVEKLKEKARAEEGTAKALRRKLGEAERRIEELRAQGGREVVRRLMDEVTELRARLQATSTAFQTRENSVAELREAVHHLRLDLRAGQEKTEAQARKLEEQGRESQEQQVTISRLEEECSRCEERVQVAEKTAEEKCAASGRELASLSTLLREANATLDASKGAMQAALAKQVKELEALRREKESLLSQKGQAKERLQELTSLCERQRSQLAEARLRLREVERLALAAKEDTRLAEDQVSRLRAELSAADRGRREEGAGATIKLRAATRQAEELKAELTRVKSEAAEKARQLLRHRDEMSSFRQDVNKLREATAQQGDIQQALRDRDQTIRDLRQRLELERRERGQWGQARKQLLKEFCEEENKLRSTLQSAPQRQQTKRRPRRQKHDHEQAQEQPAFGQAGPTRSDRETPRVEKNDTLSRQSTMYSLHSYATSTSNGEAGDKGAEGLVFRHRSNSRVARGQEQEEKGRGGSEDGSLFGLTRTARAVVGNGTCGAFGTVGTDGLGVRDVGGPEAEARHEFGMRLGHQLSQQA
eukprot:g9788.t1